MKYICPLCDIELKEEFGNQLHPGDKDYGITLSCPNQLCPAQEVMGHGDNIKQAWEVITSKYRKS